jgi:hypothetical protein
MRLLLATMVISAAVGLAAAGAGDQPTVSYIDLQSKANQKLDEPFHGDLEGNDLAELPRGEQTFAKAKFKIGASLIQLGSTVVKDKPAKVEGIAVDRKLKRLYFLHATGYGNAPAAEASHVKDDTEIGHYLIHFEDKTTTKVPIVYGKDVRDWWDTSRDKETPRARLAWEGTSEAAKRANARLYLYRGTWENPHPDKRVVSIDYHSANDTAAAPFCVAITAESK